MGAFGEKASHAALQLRTLDRWCRGEREVDPEKTRRPFVVCDVGVVWSCRYIICDSSHPRRVGLRGRRLKLISSVGVSSSICTTCQRNLCLSTQFCYI